MKKEPTSNTRTPTLDAIAATRDFVSTGEAAALLNRKPQTLRKWACLDKGPIRPVRVYGRLMWCIKEIAHMLGGRTSALQPT